MKILLYSFEKFSKLQTNPAGEIAKKILKSLEKKFDVRLEILPVSSNLWQKLKPVIDSFKPQLIIGLGLKDTSKIHLEYFAYNIIDSSQPNNDGKIIRHTTISKDSLNSHITSVDILQIQQFLKQKNIPVSISYFPGTYICNLAYFHTLDYIEKNNLASKSLFIHVPFSPEEAIQLDVEKPSFPTENIANALSEFILLTKNSF